MTCKNPMTLKKVIFMLLGVGLIASVGQTQVPVGEITSSELRLTTRTIDVGDKQLLFLKLVNQFNARPDRRCNVRLASFVTRIGNEDAEPDREILATVTVPRRSRRRQRFTYFGDSVNGTINRQWQGNFQVRVKCRNQDPIFSNAIATNITCRGGVRRNNIIGLFRSGIVVD